MADIHHIKASTIIGPFSITIDQAGNVELRTFNPTDRNMLTAQEAAVLQQWLSEQRGTIMTETEHPDFGKLQQFSEHKVGDHISYLEFGVQRQGTIIWVVAAHELVSGKHMPAHYIVHRDNTGNTWPDTVFFGDIVIDS